MGKVFISKVTWYCMNSTVLHAKCCRSSAKTILGRRDLFEGHSFANVCKRQLEPKYILNSFKHVKTWPPKFFNEKVSFPRLPNATALTTLSWECLYIPPYYFSADSTKSWPVRKDVPGLHRQTTSTQSSQLYYWIQYYKLIAIYDGMSPSTSIRPWNH